MPHQITPNIRIERVSEQRVKDFYNAYLESLPELFTAGFIDTTDPASEEVGTWQDWLTELDKGWENDQQYFFQVVEVSTNQVVGGVFLNQVVRSHQMANLGYWVRTSQIGKGIATEAAKQAARYGFERLSFQRIEIVVEVGNLPSLRVAEKTGAVREGRLRNRLRLHNSPCDAYLHSLIPSDVGITETA
jgi:ribosomal-protein-serine acetyltransferase